VLIVSFLHSFAPKVSDFNHLLVYTKFHGKM